MSSPRPTARHKLGLAFGRAHRRHVAEIVLFNQKVAERLALNVTDLQCLNFIDIIGADGKLTAGQLAELAGISTGAMTRLIDRLERAGFVRRERPPEDRRRVIVRIVAERGREIHKLYGSIRTAWRELLADYSDEQIRFLLDYIKRAGALLSQESRKLEVAPSRSAVSSSVRRRGGRTRATGG